MIQLNINLPNMAVFIPIPTTLGLVCEQTMVSEGTEALVPLMHVRIEIGLRSTPMLKQHTGHLVEELLNLEILIQLGIRRS